MVLGITDVGSLFAGGLKRGLDGVVQDSTQGVVPAASSERLAKPGNCGNGSGAYVNAELFKGYLVEGRVSDCLLCIDSILESAGWRRLRPLHELSRASAEQRLYRIMRGDTILGLGSLLAYTDPRQPALLLLAAETPADELMQVYWSVVPVIMRYMEPYLSNHFNYAPNPF